MGSDPSHANDHKQSRPVGQLENSQILEDLEGYLSHLTAKERTDMVILLNEFRVFFLTFPLRPMCSHMILMLVVPSQ